MISKKLALGSLLMIASLSLSGCSALQSMINNKIASTAKDVSNSVNTEVAKTTDALKQQGETMQKDFTQAGNALKADLGILDGAIYTNTEFGFSLQFPKSWETIKEKIQTDKDGKATFITLTSKDGKYSLILDIYTIKVQPMEAGLNYVGVSGNNHYVFASYGGPDSTQEEDSRDEAIVKTFKAL